MLGAYTQPLLPVQNRVIDSYETETPRSAKQIFNIAKAESEVMIQPLKQGNLRCPSAENRLGVFNFTMPPARTGIDNSGGIRG